MGDVKDGQKIFYHLHTARDAHGINAHDVLPDLIPNRVPNSSSANGNPRDHLIENISMCGFDSTASFNE